MERDSPRVMSESGELILASPDSLERHSAAPTLPINRAKQFRPTHIGCRGLPLERLGSQILQGPHETFFRADETARFTFVSW